MSYVLVSLLFYLMDNNLLEVNHPSNVKSQQKMSKVNFKLTVRSSTSDSKLEVDFWNFLRITESD